MRNSGEFRYLYRTNTTGTNKSLTLIKGKKYYVSVQAVDNVRNVSEVITSNGVTVTTIRLTAVLLTKNVRVGNKTINRDFIRITESPGGKVTTILSPIQKTAYPTLKLFVKDTNRDGSHDTVTVTGFRKVGKRTMTLGPKTVFKLGITPPDAASTP